MTTLENDYLNFLAKQRSYFYELEKYDVVEKITKQIQEVQWTSTVIKNL